MSGDMVVYDAAVSESRDAQLAALEDQVRHLRRELAIANGEIAKAKSESARALSALRKQLSPLYRALQAVFGELDAAGVEDTSSGVAPVADARTQKIWESWKGRLGPTCGKAIDALLMQPGLTQSQLAIACGISRQHASNIISKLNTTGLINKNGGHVSLKPLGHE